eukprot:TRINITY_DN3296_c2_g3_i1.p1 TRINITY_DN3296_c2_g3~~TRINITY_DN3296_c2_g3_i1.p1  ORF type:complete len:246 (-),score=48.97 TRINITY_DN3296_c2_g3_i1:154-867(-)
MKYDYSGFFIFLTTFTLILIFVSALKSLNIISNCIARKCSHILTGSIFCYSWALLPDYSLKSKILWSFIPAFSSMLLLLSHLNIVKFKHMVNLMTRDDDAQDLIKGPFIYGIFHALLLFLSCNRLFGAIASAILCGGDGFAEIVGRKSKKKLPYSKTKTFGGTFGFFIFGSLFANILSIFLISVGFSFSISRYSKNLFFIIELIAFFSAIVESFSKGAFDNLSICITALTMGYFFEL